MLNVINLAKFGLLAQQAETKLSKDELPLGIFK
jgi:hypothetical protein